MLSTLLSVSLFLVISGHAFGFNKVAKVTNYKEVLSQIEYPKVCQEKGIEGKVIVSLKVDATGKLISYDFIESPCSDLKEAVAMVLPALRFNPAVDQNGMPVAGRITMPVNFKLTI